MDNIENELGDIKLDDPIKFGLNNKADSNSNKVVTRVGLEPAGRSKTKNKSSVVSKILFVLLMLSSSAFGAFSVWLFLF